MKQLSIHSVVRNIFNGKRNLTRIMNRFIETAVRNATRAKDITFHDEIQTLWKGYGRILRVGLQGCAYESVVVKHISFPKQQQHRKKSQSDLSHTRKLKSYKVESAWYKQLSSHCDASCRIPACFAIEQQGNDVVIVLEDLDLAGFKERDKSLSWRQVTVCLRWLAEFHATFLGKSPDGLWKCGTYWHLDTRPEELKALGNIPLRAAAGRIDMALRQTSFKTFVHGDAKVQNFCFTSDGSDVAAVDFQYVGGGCGMKDVCYFLSSCMYEDECERLEDELLDTYFALLKKAIEKRDATIDTSALEREWRSLYRFAWADFHRFYKGWSGYRFDPDSYSERVAREVISLLGR